MPAPDQDAPSNSEIAAQNPLQPTASTVSDNTIQPNTAPAPSSVNPNAVLLSQPQPTAQPQAQPNPAQVRQQAHADLFRSFLGALAGGSQRPLIGKNGQPVTDANGQVVMQPATKKTLAASILAGALSGLAAGMAAPSKYNEVAPGRFQQDYSPSVAAGAQAGQQFTQAGRQAAAQGQADENLTRQFSTADHNLKFHAMSLANDKADRENQQDVVSTWDSTRDAMDAEAKDGKVQDANGNDIDLYSYQNIPGTKAMELVNNGSLHITKDQLIPTQVIEVPNADGNGTHAETLFSVYNPAALVAMTDAIRKDNPRLTDVANGTPVPVRVLAQAALNRSNEILASSGVSDWTKEYNTVNKDNPMAKDFSLKSAAQSSPLIQKLYPYINKYRKDSVDQFFTDLQKDPAFSKDSTIQSAAALLQQKMGVTPEGLQAMATQRADVVLQQKDKEAEAKVAAEADAKRKTPEGQADLLHKQLENQALIQAAAQAKAQGQGIQVPNNFTPNPKANEMEAGALQADLSRKGVSIPPNYSALYAIAHNAADLATLPTTPRKGVNVMPRDQALSFIRTYINPQYQEGDYSAAKKLSGELASTRVGTAGGTLLSAGTAANHLNLLEQAGQALNNNDVQAINKLANTFGIAVGKSPAVTFQAIAEQVNSEVAKVVAGGQPNEAELKNNRDNLNRDQSPEQIRNVIRSYVGLMNGRIGEIDDRSMQYFGRHVKGISPTAVQVFNQHGFAAPGQVVVVDPTGKQRFFNDAASADNFKKLAGIQ